MSAPQDIPELCQRCNERKATVAIGTGFKDGHLQFRHLCSECSEIETTDAPKSLQELLDQLERKEKPE